MSKNQTTRTAIITGAIRGIGLAIARNLSESGVRCVLTYYDWLEDLDAMHETMKKTGTEYHAVQVDLTDPEGAGLAVSSAIERFGRLDILINNIERGGWPVVHGPYTERQWRLEFDTTVTAKWGLFQAALPHLKETGDGAVVNISSISGIVGRNGPAGHIFPDCYSFSNRSIQLLTETWARMGAPQVRVNELMLGFMDTRHGPRTRGWGILTEDQKEAILSHTLLGRTGRPEEVARAVRFLAMEAGFMTGAVVRMDGGYVLGGEKAVPVPAKGVVGEDEPLYGGKKD